MQYLGGANSRYYKRDSTQPPVHRRSRENAFTLRKPQGTSRVAPIFLWTFAGGNVARPRVELRKATSPCQFETIKRDSTSGKFPKLHPLIALVQDNENGVLVRESCQ